MDDDCDETEQRLNLFNGDCNYYELKDLENVSIRGMYEYRVVHLNIQSLPSKFDNLKIMLQRFESIGKHLDFVLLCETFLTQVNKNNFAIDGYNFVRYTRKKSKRGGVAIYTRNNIDFAERSDLALVSDGEFESVFIQVKSQNKSKLVVGEIYRVPGTNEKQSIERYSYTIDKLNDEKCDYLIGTDQNFDFAKIDHHMQTAELFDAFCSRGVVPTINKPTRITHSTATIIDNIYVKGKNDLDIKSGIITYSISDHMPVFVFISKKKDTKIKEPLNAAK